MRSVFHLHSRCQSSGMALVIVLFSLVIVTTLVVCFLVMVQMEVKASASYQATAATQRLSDMAVDVEQAEISAATSQQAPNIWASQPGAIWVFNGTGAPSTIYRLYSWPSMQAATGSALLADATTISSANWSNSPAVWVDLNAESPSGRYPIVDPTATIDGFSIPNPPGTAGTAPMPVQWLYVLQNGSVVAPTAVNGSVVTVTGASASNPIVGRIGYWTDDESSKVNVNTAGGDDGYGNSGVAAPVLSSGVATAATYANIANATFWDTPHYGTPDDTNLAVSQPVQGEYQRYPGHPGSTALNYLLSSLMATNLTSTNFYSLTPRYTYGGSEGGTGSSWVSSIPNKGDRLYVSLEDMLFASTNRAPSVINGQNAATSAAMEKGRFFLTAHNSAPELNLFGQPRISMWPLWDEHTPSNTSYNTANNSWPATTPVPSDANHITPFDQTLSFCSTLISGANAYPYYFTRSNNTNAAPPVAFSNQNYILDASLPRNQKLLGYLDYLTSQPVPGFGGTFGSTSATSPSSKWNSHVPAQLAMRQVLTEIFDYIRTIDSMDPNLPIGTTYPINVYAAGTPGSGQVVWSGSSMGEGQVVPTVQPAVNGSTWNTQGYGSFPRLVEADLEFVAVGAGTNTITGAANTPVFSDQTGARGVSTGMLSSNTNLPPTNSVAVQAYLLLNFINPAHSLPPSQCLPVFFVEVSGLNKFSLNGKSLGFTSDDMAVGGAIKTTASMAPYSMVGPLDFRSMVADRILGPGIFGNSANVNYYPFYSSIIGITNNGGSGASTMAFTNTTSSPVAISIYTPANTSYATASSGLQYGDLVQTYNLNFPTTNFPVPTLAALRRIGTYDGGSPNWGVDGGYNDATGNNTLSTNSDRWRDEFNAPTYPMTIYFQSGNNIGYDLADATTTNITTGSTTTIPWTGQDVVEGMVLNTNWTDARMLAITNVPSSAFVPHPLYGTANPFAYGINIPGSAANCPGSTSGRLVGGAGYNANTLPLVPVTASVTTGVTNSVAGTQPDWDNGIASFPDGPYINKSDEGKEPTGAGVVPYFTWAQPIALNSYFSPNREVPSPGMLGSLPTGVDPTGNNPQGWQTLLFRPGPANHPGSTSPEDELLLDLFWMPVTDPYPISEAFSTAGKVNLNYEIVPFTYINRSTAMRAVLAGEKVAAVNTSNASTYKVAQANPAASLNVNARLALNLGIDTGEDGGTLQQFRDMFSGTGSFFASGQPSIFRSAAQICDIYLVPQGYSWSSPSTAQNAWYSSAFGLVGDNERERPYTDLYSKVTTKSNTFRVYYTVQSLKAGTSDLAQGQWNEAHGTVTGQYIGSTTIERYIDPNNSSIQDYASSPNTTPNLESAYRWRVVDNHQFVP